MAERWRLPLLVAGLFALASGLRLAAPGSLAGWLVVAVTGTAAAWLTFEEALFPGG